MGNHIPSVSINFKLKVIVKLFIVSLSFFGRILHVRTNIWLNVMGFIDKYYLSSLPKYGKILYLLMIPYVIIFTLCILSLLRGGKQLNSSKIVLFPWKHRVLCLKRNRGLQRSGDLFLTWMKMKNPFSIETLLCQVPRDCFSSKKKNQSNLKSMLENFPIKHHTFCCPWIWPFQPCNEQ